MKKGDLVKCTRSSWRDQRRGIDSYIGVVLYVGAAEEGHYIKVSNQESPLGSLWHKKEEVEVINEI